MIELHAFPTPNGKKIPIALEELGMKYTVHLVDFRNDEQHKPEFLAINPNGKIPALVDKDGPEGVPITIFESGAILVYLADKAGGALLPKQPHARFAVLEWLFFQVSAVGPFFGQHSQWERATPRNEGACDKYRREVIREIDVLEAQLARRVYLAGDYSIADISTYTWVEAKRESNGELFERTPNVNAWLDRVGSRPAVKRGMDAATWPRVTAA